ncbi:MAG: acetate/propionate family kinase [Acetobacteraceae bacterium]
MSERPGEPEEARAENPAPDALIAVFNAGSSSIKFGLFGANPKSPLRLRGEIEGLGAEPRLRVRDADGKSLAEKSWSAGGLDHDQAARTILELLADLVAGAPVRGVGHRVVHGGRRYGRPVRIDDAVLRELAELAPLAPLHQPHNLAVIRAIRAHRPSMPQVACFDTAFHRDEAPLARAFGLPRAWQEAGIERYGFHGISYEYITSRLGALAPRLAPRRLIIAHLGNGASLCAVKAGQSVATTMGLTALDGLMMGTRPGAIDPGVILYLMNRHGMDATAVGNLLYRQSGLLGVSGIASDMRTLRASSDPRAAEAIALFVYRIVREIGSLTAALGGLDGLVFTAGIGENDPATRAEVALGCGWLGLELDQVRNQAGKGRINAERSRIETWVVPTDEEGMIARHTVALLG